MSGFWIFLLVDVIAVVLVISSCPLRGLSRVLAPETFVTAVLFAVFAIRPLYADRRFYGQVPTLDGQITASMVGTVLLWSIAAGVMWRDRGFAVRCTPVRASGNSSPNISPSRVVFVSVAALAIYFVGLAALIGPSAVAAMFGGRRSGLASTGVPEFWVSVPLAGSIASAVLILSRRSCVLSVPDWLAVGICTSGTLVAVSSEGSRRYIIPAILIVAIALLMRRPLRVRMWQLPVGVLVFAFMAILPTVRSAGARRGGENILSASMRSFSDEGGIAGSLRYMFTSFDTEMYDFIAMLAPELKSGRISLGWGRGTIIEFIAHPFPKALTPFAERTLELKQFLFNYQCLDGFCNAPFPVLSAGGTFYFDGWYFGVLIGGVGTGFILRWLSQRWSHSSEFSIQQNIFTSVCASYAMIAVRTDTIYAIWWCIYALVVAFAVVVALGARQSSPSNGWRGVNRRNLRQYNG